MIPTTPVSPLMAPNGLLSVAVDLNPALMEIIASLCFTLIAVDIMLGVYDS